MFCDVTGIHRTMENAKIRSLRMDSKVWTRPLIKVFLLFAVTKAVCYNSDSSQKCECAMSLLQEGHSASYCQWMEKMTFFVTSPPVGGRGIVFARFACLFVCFFFVSLSATLWESGWTDLHEIFDKCVEWPWDDLVKFWVNSGKRVGGSKVNLLSPAIAQSQLHSLGASRSEVCCAPHHSLFFFWKVLWRLCNFVVVIIIIIQFSSIQFKSLFNNSSHYY